MNIVRCHIRFAAFLMLTIMICLIVIRTVHCHMEEKHDSWEGASLPSYESNCCICLFVSSLVFDLVQDDFVYFNFAQRILFFLLIFTVVVIYCFPLNLRGPPFF